MIKSIPIFACSLALILASVGPGNVAAANDDDDQTMGWFIPSGTPAKNFYAGASAGYGKIDYPDSNQDGSVTNISSDDTDVVGSAYVGYQINEYVGVQGGYNDFGESDFSGVSDGSGESWVAGDVSANLDSDGWEVGVYGRWPLSDRWSVLGFVGMLWWESTETFNENGFITVEKETGNDASYGLGVEYDIGMKERVVYRFMGAHRRVDDTGYDVDSASAEIVYRFP